VPRPSTAKCTLWPLLEPLLPAAAAAIAVVDKICYFTVMDRLTERIAEMDRAAQARAERVRSRLASVACLLHQKGARRIWLFGSMASGGHPHGDSDVDLFVEGLPALGLIRTLLEVEQVLGVEVDLIRLEESSDSLRARIACEGEEQYVPA